MSVTLLVLPVMLKLITLLSLTLLVVHGVRTQNNWQVSSSMIYIWLFKTTPIVDKSLTMCFSTYSRCELCQVNGSQVTIPLNTIDLIRSLGITRRPKGRRKYRGGLNSRRNINTLIGNRPSPLQGQLGVFSDNLVRINQVPADYTSNVPFHGGLLNCQSLRSRKKTAAVVDYIVDNDLDMLAVTETWFKDEVDRKHIGDVTPAVVSVISASPDPKWVGSV